MESDFILLADVIEKFIKLSIKDFEINPLYCVSICSHTIQCCLKYTDIKLQSLQDKDMILFIENNRRGGLSSTMVDRFVKSDENDKLK